MGCFVVAEFLLTSASHGPSAIAEPLVFKVALVGHELQLVSTCILKYEVCGVCVIDYFPDECRENAEEECSEFRAEVPLSEMFNSTAFSHFCRYQGLSNSDGKCYTLPLIS